MMDSVMTKHSTEGRKGLQQRRSFSDMMDQNDGLEDGDLVKEMAAQSADMQRSISGQSSVESLESWKSASSVTTESSFLTEATTVNTSSGQPINFGTVVPGVYRSSYPREEDYEFIQKLKLKTIVTLVDKDVPETFIPFMQANGIQHHKIVLQGTKKETVPISTMAAILQVVHDKRNHPMLIHCNQGRNWDLLRILEEYKTYAAPKIRDCDVEYVTKFQVADIQHLALAPLPETAPLPFQHPVKSRRTRFLIVAFFLIFICWNTFRVFRQMGWQSSQHDATSSL
ncbi:tyrosine-protein phosphatase siw14 [Cytospora paraplurivora]|uniref:Tyrosine-protein phosphatase siw14 n=1 Tax=Cytospora paraplurivora TaxID=2898453 RepID=A0AAN9YDK6_9PEZI